MKLSNSAMPDSGVRWAKALSVHSSTTQPPSKFVSILSIIAAVNARANGVRKEGSRTFFCITSSRGDFEIEHSGCAEQFEQDLFKQLQTIARNP